MSSTAPPPLTERDTATEPERRPPRARVVVRHTQRALGVTGSWFVSKIPELVLQSVLIVFSIVVGLWVNDRIGERSDHDLKVALLNSFEKEIAENLAQLQINVRKQDNQRNTLRVMAAAGQLRTADLFYDSLGVEGFRRTPLVTTAWQTAVATGVLRQLDDDYATATALSRTYTQQAEYERTSESRMPEFLRTGTYPQGSARGMVRAAERFLEDETEDEEKLAAVYREALERIAAARRRLGG